MPIVATWLRDKDKKWFQPFFEHYPEVQVCNAAEGEVDMSRANGLLLTGGADIAPEFLNQPVPPGTELDRDIDATRDAWEFRAVSCAMARGVPIFAICKGMQVLNVALGGTLHLDIRGHRGNEMREHDVQPLRFDRQSEHQFERVNSSHHQAVDQVGAGLAVEAWCATDDIIEQMRLSDYPFGLAVQYHPERGNIYDELFEDFFVRIRNHR
jgi:putative glutamine amidotransferase